MNCSRALTGIGVAVALLAAGCSDSEGPDRSSGSVETSSSTAAISPTATAQSLPDVALPVPRAAEVDGLVTVDGHELAVHCRGVGHPIVVILHGWIDKPGVTSHNFYGPLTNALKPDFRTCSYDRANVGGSQTVPGTQTPEMVVGDLHGLMKAIGEPGPYVLIGQSAGGMVASAYAVAHPEKVAGIVMIDADFDEEITIEDVGMVPRGAGPCDPVNRKADGQESLQKIDVCAMYKWAYTRRARRPEVPLIYLASRREPWSDMDEFGPRYAKAIVPLQKSYARSWSPGKFVWVNSGHDIHHEKPSVVADAVRWVMRSTGRN